VLLAVAAAGILGLGMLLKPARPETKQQPVVSQTERARLQSLAERKSLEAMGKYFSDLASQVAPSVVAIQSGLSGVVWDEQGMVVSAALPSGAHQSLRSGRPGGAVLRLAVAAASPDVPVTALAAPSRPGVPVKKASAEKTAAGSWIVEISRASDGRLLFTPGVFGGTGPAECAGFRYREVHASLPLHAGVLGGGLFDADGGLLAIVGRCGERYTAIAAEDVDAAVRRAGAVPARILQRYGMRLAALDTASRSYFKIQDGALITEIWKGRLADWVGLAPGDIITGLDGIAVDSPEDLERLLVPLPGGFFSLDVRRAAGTSRVSLPASESLVRAARPPGGLGVSLQAPGFVAESVEPGSRAYRAGVRAGDRVLRVGPRRVLNLAAARRLLSRPIAAPTYLLVERGDRTLGLLVE